MKNPWEEISLSDYENHMKLDSVMQLQALNGIMKAQVQNDYPVSDMIILGIAGGNGLEHISKEKFKKVYGIDVNRVYIKETVRRYRHLDGILKCLCIDLTRESHKLPKADMVVADLLIEYIGYECFQNALRQSGPQYVSCVIQVSAAEGSWVSESPYLHVFDRLEQIHRQIEKNALEKAVTEIGYHMILTSEHMLPDGKKLVRLDFEKN